MERRTDNIIAMIDAELNRPPVTIEQALVDAVCAGRMSVEEANDCMEAYQNAFMHETHLD